MITRQIFERGGESYVSPETVNINVDIEGILCSSGMESEHEDFLGYELYKWY